MNRLKTGRWRLNRSRYLKIHKAITGRAFEIAGNKSHDYGSCKDVLSNFRSYESFGISARQGLMSRIVDKVSRLSNHANGLEFQVTEETVRDTVLDLVNYAVLYFCLSKDVKKK